VPKGLVAGHAFVLEAIVDDYLIREGEIEFSKPIARAVLRDRRLSFGARGLFIFVWDLPAGWRPNIGHLSRMGPERKDAIRSRLRELQNVGAIRFEPIQSDDGKLRGTRWILVNPQKWARISPLKSSGSEPATEDRKIRESVGQTLGDPDAKGLQFHGSAIEAELPPQQQRQKGCTASAAVIKRLRIRASGIITWNVDDELLADSLEKEYSEELIKVAVAAIDNPLPGIVQAELLRQVKAKRAAAALNKIHQQSSSEFISEMGADPDAVQAGECFLRKTREAKARRRTHAS
jgi:hypothetical protein